MNAELNYMHVNGVSTTGFTCSGEAQWKTPLKHVETLFEIPALPVICIHGQLKGALKGVPIFIKLLVDATEIIRICQQK